MGAREESDWICSTEGPVMRNKSGNKTPICKYFAKMQK